MTVEYSKHLKVRLALRSIDHEVPELIFKESKEKYIDNETGHHVAVKKILLYGKERDVMIAYTKRGDSVKILTIHPLKTGQKENRVQAGRWRKV